MGISLFVWLFWSYTILLVTTNREASVDSSLIRQGVGERRDWNVHFNRGPKDWEAELVDDSFRFLVANLPSTDDGDRMRWK